MECRNEAIISRSNEIQQHRTLGTLWSRLFPFPLASLSNNIGHGLYLTYLSAGLVVVQVHQADWVFRPLSAFPSVLSIHKSSREGDAKVNVVRTAGPL